MNVKFDYVEGEMYETEGGDIVKVATVISYVGCLTPGTFRAVVRKSNGLIYGVTTDGVPSIDEPKGLKLARFLPVTTSVVTPLCPAKPTPPFIPFSKPKCDMTLRELQTTLPWTIRYSNDFRSSPMSHKDFAHALHHVSKAVGKLHGLADDMGHDRTIADDTTLREQYGKYIADLVVCALRLANTSPGGVVDLQRAVQDRIEGKNWVQL